MPAVIDHVPVENPEVSLINVSYCQDFPLPSAMLPRLELLPIMLSSPQRKQRGILRLERICWMNPSCLSVKSTSLVQPFFVVIKSGLLVQAPCLSILCFRKTVESFIVFLYTTAFSSTPKITRHRLASRYEGVKSYSALQMRTMRRPVTDGDDLPVRLGLINI